MKNRQVKQEEYKNKYGHIPIEINERLEWMVDHYNLSEHKMSEILQVRDNMIHNLYTYQCKVVQLFEEPEGASRPRFRIINKANFSVEARSGQFVHVYTPNARQDYLYMKKLTEEELTQLDGLVNTPCIVTYNAFLRTPQSFSINEIFLAEIGVIRPNISKPDFDNIAKKYADMYNHNVWLDDALVVDGTVRKFYSILPRVEIDLQFLNTLYTKKQFISLSNRKEYDGGQLSYLNREGELCMVNKEDKL